MRWMYNLLRVCVRMRSVYECVRSNVIHMQVCFDTMMVDERRAPGAVPPFIFPGLTRFSARFAYHLLL